MRAVQRPDGGVTSRQDHQLGVDEGGLDRLDDRGVPAEGYLLTEKVPDALGLPEYYAMEAFVKWAE